jgi:hypothetical protein
MSRHGADPDVGIAQGQGRPALPDANHTAGQTPWFALASLDYQSREKLAKGAHRSALRDGGLQTTTGSYGWQAMAMSASPEMRINFRSACR